MPIEIRAAIPTDLPAIIHVRTSVRENHLSVEEMAALGVTPESIIQTMEQSPCCWVAVEAGEIVGFSMIDASEGALFAAFVLPAHEGKGIGRRLVAVAESQLFRDHARIWLETGQSTRAAGFYQSLGWGNAQIIGADDIRLEKQRP